MFLNQLRDRSADTEALAQILAESLTVPTSDGEAITKITALHDHVESIKVGGHPAPGRVPLLLSYFWALADHDRWSVIWPSSEDYLTYLTGKHQPTDQSARYQTYLERVRELSSDHVEFEMTAEWWKKTSPAFLDEVLADRADFGLNSEGSATEELEENAQVLVNVARHLGSRLARKVSEALGREVKFSTPQLEWKTGRPRGDLWADWWTEEAPGLGMRVWVNHKGAAVALRPALARKGWRVEIIPIIEAADYTGCRALGGSRSVIGEDVGFFGRTGEFVYGRWFGRDELAGLDLSKTVVEVATQLKPLFEELLGLALGSPVPLTGDSLSTLVAEFRDETKYPNPEAERYWKAREHFAGLLAADTPYDLDALSRIWNTGDYGYPGMMPELKRSINSADTAEIDRIGNTLRYLCWGEDPDAERIDRVLTNDEYRVSGFGESVIMKLLSITHPETYIPVFPYEGDNGKKKLLQLLKLREPEGARGKKQVESNRLLRDLLEPFFTADAWGISRFLYWYRDRETPETVDERDLLGELTNDLLVDRSFVDNLVALLEKKRQVVFYGPPGTGKTYLARELAKALAPDPGCRAIVQFHPASSYEDFFEGYRPAESGSGDIVYRLTPGPLARMAERAAANPSQQHLIIIDEINRANLPKVLGELLFLLEYRDESVQTLYRPEHGFRLPENLWFIGTMNTADRSIALVDAALRRRFHFVPFFPNDEDGPIAGLLERWLDRHGEPAWVGELVTSVNEELESDLGGPHLLLGPSYFMERGLSEDAMRRIWQYDIEPLLEDQFFGDIKKSDKYRFDSVHRRYCKRSGTDLRTDQAHESSGVGPTESDIRNSAAAENGETAERSNAGGNENGQ